MQIIGSTREVFFDRAAILLLVSRAEFWDVLLRILFSDGDAGFGKSESFFENLVLDFCSFFPGNFGSVDVFLIF